jgi:hypothetical protein
MIIQIGNMLSFLASIAIFAWFTGICGMFWFMNDSGATRGNKIGFWITELVSGIIWFSWWFNLIHLTW